MSEPPTATGSASIGERLRSHLRAFTTGGHPEPKTDRAKDDADRRAATRRDRLLVAYGVLVVAALIALRAVVDALDFLGVGWILVLAALPLLPWLLPRLGQFLRSISPYVQSLKLGALQIDLRTVKREPISVPSSGTLAGVPNDVTALSSGTQINELISALRGLRRAGAGPVGVIDLQAGNKWLWPNLYFLARMLETDTLVSQLVFTEARGGSDGYVLGSCRPDELRRHIEQRVPSYASASQGVAIPSQLDLDKPASAQAFGDAFKAFREELSKPVGATPEFANGYVTSDQIRTNFLGLLNPTAIEAVSGPLGEKDVQAVLESPHRFVPATLAERLAGLIDREAVALEVARAAVRSATS